MAPMPPLTPSAALRFSIVEQILDAAKPASVVEVGCGQGAMAYRLASRFDYRGFEPDEASFQVAKRRLAELGRGEVLNDRIPGDPDRHFGALCAFEVLEHMEHDTAALTAWVRWVEPPGLVILSVPAHPERFGACDVAVGHCRRYTREALETVMVSAGVEVMGIHAWGMPAGYVLELSRNLASARTHSDCSVEERTATSGRLYQPSDRWGRVTEWVMKPFAYLQRPFSASNLGVGFVAFGQVRL